MPKRYRFIPIAAVIGCAHAVSPPPVIDDAPVARYNVTIFDNFDGARVYACFEGFAPSHLSPVDADAQDSLRHAWLDDAPLDVRAGRINLPSPTRNVCVSYETHFENEMFRAEDGRAVLVSQGEWLWRPEPFPTDLDTTVSFTLPTGGRASLPWVYDGSVYRPSADVFRQGGYNVFGIFSEAHFSAGDVSVTVARLGTGPADDHIRRWLTSAIGAAASVGHEFPVRRLHFVVVPVGHTGRPVVFGMVRRAGGVSVLLIASTTAKVDELEADWIAIHELSHLWLPRVYSQDRWLTEGITTYLQEVLRARCGLQSAQVSWDRIRDGFKRGRLAGTSRVLTRESRDMGLTGAYFRVYWAGTAFALEADLRLRKQSGGDMTLLRALDLARSRLSTLGAVAHAEEVLAALDEVSGTDFLVPLGARYASATAFPAAELLDDPTSERIRAEIMKRESDRCVPRSVSP